MTRALNQAQCAFKRIPGKTYHLYRRANGRTFFSMLPPAEWGGSTPNCYGPAARESNLTDLFTHPRAASQ
jgi:hypothetical protein